MEKSLAAGGPPDWLPGPIAALARSGAIAGLIKLASAALAFLMFVAIALITDERQFGLFGAAYAGASLVSFVNTVGQQGAVLRFWPEHASAGRMPLARSLMARSLLVAGAAIVVSAVGVAALGLLPWFTASTPEWLPLCLATALLAAALGWSEVTSSALRAKSLLIAGLLPRDIIWRALGIAAAAGLWLAGIEISAVEAVLLCAVLLLAAVAPQSARLIADTLNGPRQALLPAQALEFRRVTSGLWGVTSLPPALGQVSTLLVAGILGPEVAGAVFVAERTTRLVAVALSGLNQALAPEISSGFHSGNTAYVQRIVSLTALASTAVGVLALLAFATFGNLVLATFEPAYATPEMLQVLLVFCLGAVIASGCGPVEVLLQLTGSEHALLKTLLVINPLGILVTAAATYFFGPLGAALSIAGSLVAWNVVGVIVARRRLRIDPSLLGLLRSQRHASGTGA